MFDDNIGTFHIPVDSFDATSGGRMMMQTQNRYDASPRISVIVKQRIGISKRICAPALGSAPPGAEVDTIYEVVDLV